jgi:quinol monooxygenase YgiN
MATRTVHLLVETTIYEGRFDLFESLAQEMVAVSLKEPGTLAYDWYLSGDRRRCRLMETYVDANALLVHFQGPAVQQLVPMLLEHSRLERFEVYGDPGSEATTMLAGFGAEIFQSWHTLSR